MGLEKGCTGVAPIAISPKSPLTEFSGRILATPNSAGLKTSAQKQEMLPLGHITMIPVNGKLRQTSGHLVVLCN